jgi:hypothetical protein
MIYHLAEASRLYREAVDKQVKTLQKVSESSDMLTQDLKVVTAKVREKLLSVYVVLVLKLDDKELGFVKQLKTLQAEHSNLQRRRELLESSKKKVMENMEGMLTNNGQAAKVITDLEKRISVLLDQAGETGIGTAAS